MKRDGGMIGMHRKGTEIVDQRDIKRKKEMGR
jgi:hypothetical protein